MKRQSETILILIFVKYWYFLLFYREASTAGLEPSRYTELYTLINIYLDATQDVIESSSLLSLSEHKLIGKSIFFISRKQWSFLKNVKGCCFFKLNVLNKFLFLNILSRAIEYLLHLRILCVQCYPSLIYTKFNYVRRITSYPVTKGIFATTTVFLFRQESDRVSTDLAETIVRDKCT